MWVLCDREPVREWIRGRVTLLGDAAHPMLHYLTRGACMAIEDGVSLANKMSEANGDFAAAFLAYQRALSRTGRVQAMAPRIRPRSITLPMWSVSFEIRCWSIALRNRRTNQWRGYTTTRERSHKYALPPRSSSSR